MTLRHRMRPRRGFTILELMIVVTIMGVLIAIPAPMFGRAIEQPKLDVAVANLRSIWAAERLYYLENGRYAPLPDPANPQATGTLPADLIDPTIVSGTAFYSYVVVAGSAEQGSDGTWKTSFTATATRMGSSSCSGSITITEKGTLSSFVTYAGQSSPMRPSLEPTQ